MTDDDLIRQFNRLRRQVDSLVKPETGRWESWTPVITQSVVVAKTINYANYIIRDKICEIQCELTVTGFGIANNIIYISGWPSKINPTNAGHIVGNIYINDSGVFYVGIALVAAVTAILGRAHLGGSFGVTPNFALFSGDVISMCATWEIS